MIDGYRADLRRYAGKERVSWATQVRLLGAAPGLQALLGYRLGRALLAQCKRPAYWPLLPFGWLAYWLISRYVRAAFDIRLHLSARIGAGLYIGHFGNILVHHCQIGAYCSIAQSVHLRPADTPQGPTIEDRVWIGAHAQIVGSYRIGSNSTIGAGAVVLRDVPQKALCLGNPARVVTQNYDNSSILRLDALGLRADAT